MNENKTYNLLPFLGIADIFLFGINVNSYEISLILFFPLPLFFVFILYFPYLMLSLCKSKLSLLTRLIDLLAADTADNLPFNSSVRKNAQISLDCADCAGSTSWDI